MVIGNWIDINKIKELHDNHVEKAVELSKLDHVTDYDKGIVAGKILALREIMNDECPRCGDGKLKNLLVCNNCYTGEENSESIAAEKTGLSW